MLKNSVLPKLVGACMVSAIALQSGSALAQDSMPTRQELLAMLKQQQKQLNALQAQLEKQGQQAAQSEVPVEKQASAMQSFMESVKIGGLLEFEATAGEDFAGVNSSDLSLAKAELSFSAQPHEYVTTNVVALYEDGADPFNLDEATITIAAPDKFPLYTILGKWVVPFGNYDTDMSSDPITLTLGETKENAVLAGAGFNGFSMEAYVFNGDTRKNNAEDQIDQFGLSLGYEGDFDGVGLAFGAGYINNIADTNGVNAVVNGAAALNDYVSGTSLHGSVSVADFVFRGGYVQANDEFRTGELAFNGRGAKPVAWNTELAYNTEIAGKATTFAATYQGSDEALALALPEKRYGAAVTVGVFDSTALTVEVLHSEDYSRSEGGTGGDAVNATTKLAVEF